MELLLYHHSPSRFRLQTRSVDDATAVLDN